MAQQESGLEPELWACFEPSTGTVLLTAPAESFLDRVDFDQGGEGVVSRLLPVGKESPVIIDPEIRFGSPAVAGIPTDTLAEMVRAGDSIESVASGYNLSLSDVVAALNYELSRAPAA
jgi:uncharacterized protein (DUF433 family)